jgi:dihydropyrimidinase
MNLLIQNAQIFSGETKVQTDLLIENGKISKVAADIQASEEIRSYDAKGMLLLPGGVDPHVHMHLPVAGGFSEDDFERGSLAALLGGTTSMIDFVTPKRGQTLTEALEIRIGEAKKSKIDYSFHISPVEWRSTTAREIGDCVEAGFPSFKVYLAYLNTIGLQEVDLRRVMQSVSEAGGMVTAHCENGIEVDRLRDQFFNEGKTSPKYHPLSRPDYTEAESVKMAIRLADETHCPLYIVHVSTTAALHEIRLAKQRGQKVFAETCPHYLLFEDSCYDAPFEQSAAFVMSPPLRKKTDSEALWNALSTGLVDTLGTDHCPFTMQMKMRGKDDFRQIPGGVPGIGYRLYLIYSYGYLQNKQLNGSVLQNIFASNAARIFSLNTKGTLQPGADADLVLFRTLEKGKKLTESSQIQYDTDIYSGLLTFGEVSAVFKGGEIVVEEGRIADNCSGKLLKRFSNP